MIVAGAGISASTIAAASPAGGVGAFHVAEGSAATSTTNSNILKDVSCVSPVSCMAVGTVAVGYRTSPIKTLTEHWNGKSWSVVSSPNPTGARNSQLLGVSCTSATNCFAVGFSAAVRNSLTALAERWNGKAWSIVSAPGGTLQGVSCLTASFCVAVGDAIERWNGKTWSIMEHSADGQRSSSVSCTSTTSCMVVGGVHAERWNGKNWSTVPNAQPNAGSMHSVSCASAANCVGVATEGGCVGCFNTIAARWNGKVWSRLTTAPEPDNAGTELNGVSCVSATSCMAVGTSSLTTFPKRFAEQWNGTTWTVAPVAQPDNAYGNLAALSCPNPTSCIAVGYSQPLRAVNDPGPPQTAAEAWNYTSWSNLAIPNPG